MKKTKQYFNWQDRICISEAALKSSTFTECLINIGLHPYPSKINTLKKYLNLHKIDYSHFSMDSFLRTHLNKLSQMNSTPAEKIFVSNSLISKQALRRFIIKNNTLPYYCTDCGNQGEWLGKPLKLQLDHINGEPQDNRIENLRWLCPNCHSQTPTFTGRNVKKNKKEKIKNLSYKTPIKIPYPELNCLVNMLKEKSFVQVAKELNCSDNAIRKHLKRNGIDKKNCDNK